MSGRSWIVAALALAIACGARTGVGAGESARDGAVADARPSDGAPFDAPDTDAPLPPDSGEPLACDGRPMPRPGAVAPLSVSPRGQGLGVLIPDPPGVLVVGGLADTGVFADRMSFLDLGSGSSIDLPVLGAEMPLPLSDATAVYVPIGDRVIVIGGTSNGGGGNGVFSINGEGDPTGMRVVRARRLPEYPLGPVSGHVAIYDPVAHRVIVHGGAGAPGPTLRTTLALELDPEHRFVEIVPPDASPPHGTRAMGYDPRRHRAIELTSEEGATEIEVWALSLELGAERWERIGTIDFSPSMRGELIWDESVCGFHLLSARRTRCVLEHWILTVEGDRVTTVYRGDLALDPAHFTGYATYVPGSDRLLVMGSNRCDMPLEPSTVGHSIALAR